MRDDLALVAQIPLFELDDVEEYTLDMHLAFGRLTEAVPRLVDALEESERNLDLVRGGYDVALARLEALIDVGRRMDEQGKQAPYYRPDAALIIEHRGLIYG